jgi:hypothetical protein
MNKFASLNRNLLDQVKKAFVSMPQGGGQGPVAGGGMLTQAQAAPMGDPSQAGGDPNAMAAQGGGVPMDPSMMGGDPAAGGGVPMDPSMMGGIDPSMLGGAGGAAGAADAASIPTPPTGQIMLSPDEFIKSIQALGSPSGKSKPKAGAGSPDAGASQGQPAPASGNGGGGGSTSALEGKLDQLLQLLSGAPGGGQPQ